MVSLLAKSRYVVYRHLAEIYRGKMSFEVKFQVQIRQKCRSKRNDIGHTLELGLTVK